jgi:hypothetical protein
MTLESRIKKLENRTQAEDEPMRMFVKFVGTGRRHVCGWSVNGVSFLFNTPDESSEELQNRIVKEFPDQNFFLMREITLDD